jgi:hypothetical protein
MWLLTKSNQKSSSRSQIQIKEVKDGVLMLPHNRYRVVLETSAINFELKSTAEQDVIVDTFQNLLNALPCPVQILVRVREIDVDQYVEQILSSKDKEHEKAYKNQIKNYAEFIEKLVSGNKILSRHFYIIVPFTKTDRKQDFEMVKGQLKLFEDVIVKGLERLGMRIRKLNSLEVLDLFYNYYNSSQSKVQPITDLSIKEVFNHVES